MGIIGWIILGALAGVIAKAILPGDDPGGIIITPLIGIAGALIAGFIAQAVGFGDPIDEFFDWSTWIAAIIGWLATGSVAVGMGVYLLGIAIGGLVGMPFVIAMLTVIYDRRVAAVGSTTTPPV